MHATRLHIKCIFFLALVSLNYSKHISFYVEDIKRMLLQKESCDGVCMTPECVKTAARIISDLDESVDPCDNFYRFACGGWLSSHDIPEGKVFVSVDSTIQDEINLKMKTLIEKKLDGTEPAYVKMLIDMYDSCMDLETINKLGNEPLKKDLASFGGWPVIEGSKWNESSFDWVDTLIAFHRLGYNHDLLFSLYVGEDRNRKTHIIKVDRLYWNLLNDESFILGLNDTETADYYKMGVKSAVLLGANVTTAEKELLKALQFQIELAKILPKNNNKDEKDENQDKKDVSKMHKEKTAAEFRDKRKIKRRERRDVSGMNSIYTVSELQDMMPQIPWLRYFNGLLNYEIRETESVVVVEPVYLKKLYNLLEKTEKRVLANHMFWSIVHYNMIHDLPDPEDKSQVKRRPEDCFSVLQNYFYTALNTYFVRHFFEEEIRNAVMELLKYIHREFLRILEGSDWMDDVTKKEAIEKANSMKTFMVYPKEYLNDSAIMEIYGNLKISNSSFYRNKMNIKKWQTDSGFSELRKPYIEDDFRWFLHAREILDVNAYYDEHDNSIRIPAGQVLNEYFEKDRPRYMNFGGIGWVIGHEITHGFDVNGKQYDKDGNKVDWWDKTTDELYHKRVQCMIEQYSNYTLEDGIKLNGGFTIGDDMADNGGVKAAYRAYHSWVDKNGPEPLLPAIKYNQDQLFWISFAQTFCQKKEPEELRSDLLLDNHSPDEYRVIGSLSNLPEFSRDFNCPTNSPMNRKNKCHVW